MKESRPWGFTLTEVLVTVVALGVLAGIAVPVYSRVMEKARESEARTGLKTVYMGQKIYRMDKGAYYDNAGGGLPAINEALNIELESNGYYDIETTATSTDFLATAVRKNDPAKCFQTDKSGAVTSCP